jgi:multiple sugar transport system permease protein
MSAKTESTTRRVALPGFPKGARRPAEEPRPKREYAAYAFLAPYLVLFTAFVLLPAGIGLWMSLHDWTYLGPHPWSGFSNYTRLFHLDHAIGHFYWQSMANTGIFVLLSVPLLVVIPLAVALVMNAKIPGRNFFRAVYFAPYVLGVAVIGILWRFMLDPNSGIVNNYLHHAFPWTTDLPWAWISLVGVTVWWTLGFNAVIYLAGLQDISAELYEAARMDGATRWQQFRHVTLPGLRPVMVFITTVTLIASANMFGQSLLITAGAPSHETRTAVMFIADEGLRSYRLGQAAAMSFVLALFLAVLGIVNFRVFRNKEA